MPVRTIRVECIVPKDRKDALRELAIACQRMKNRLWQIWLCHHSNNNSAAKLREHFDVFNAWKASKKKGGKPAWPCKVVDAPLTKSADPGSFYRILSAEFPGVNVRTRGLLTNAWQSLLGKRKSATGSLPGWVSILFANESLPSFTRPQPIPFDADNAKLACPEDGPQLTLRIEREADSGKSTVDTLPLLLNKRKARNARVIFNRLLAGEYAWKGSNLIYDRGKWFAELCYEMPRKEHIALDPRKVLYVRPGRRSPWRVRVGASESWAFGGNGLHVENARRRLIAERRSRGAGYRWASSTTKGHGRRRANAAWVKLSDRWRDFTKRYNHEVTRQLVRLAVSRGCGRIVYFQSDGNKPSRYLTNAGNDGRSAMSWDYFQFGTMLASKCETEGIEYGKEKTKAKSTKAGVRGVRKAVSAKPSKVKK